MSSRKDQNEAVPQPYDVPREHVRADDHIPVYYELLKEGEQEPHSFEWEAIFDDIEPSPEENPRLYELLFDINQKLNMLINHMAGSYGFKMPEAHDVNISGGGLRFLSELDFKEGDRLLLKTFLPTYAHVIKLKCEVVRVRPSGGKFEVAVRYTEIDETTREKIIRYIFSRQRRTLRTGKDEDMETGPEPGKD